MFDIVNYTNSLQKNVDSDFLPFLHQIRIADFMTVSTKSPNLTDTKLKICRNLNQHLKEKTRMIEKRMKENLLCDF